MSEKLLIVDGVKYTLYVPKDEKEFEGLVKEHFSEIFGKDSLYFDIKPELRSEAGIGSKPDAIVICLGKPSVYVIEYELKGHPIHDHVVAQISKFNKAFKSSETKLKLATAVHDEVSSDLFKKALTESKVKGELFKFFTDLFLSKPEVVIIVDEATKELKEAVEDLPFKSKIVEFKTFVREGVGLSVHAHLFEPLYPLIQGEIHKPEIEVTRRAERGEITPPYNYRLPILEALIEMGGSGRTQDVLDRVYNKMKDQLKPKDLEMIPSGTDIRWKKIAQWERLRLKNEGYLKKDSPRGMWEITDEGRKLYERLKQKQ